MERSDRAIGRIVSAGVYVSIACEIRGVSQDEEGRAKSAHHDRAFVQNALRPDQVQIARVPGHSACIAPFFFALCIYSSH
jgi:hypothetical protein